LSERSTKIVYEGADDTLNDGERLPGQLKETKKVRVVIDAFLMLEPWWARVTDMEC
jgi:hypothetical protein